MEGITAAISRQKARLITGYYDMMATSCRNRIEDDSIWVHHLAVAANYKRKSRFDLETEITSLNSQVGNLQATISELASALLLTQRNATKTTDQLTPNGHPDVFEAIRIVIDGSAARSAADARRRGSGGY